MKNPPFNKVLCKRTLTSGKPFWWDDEGTVAPPDHPKRHDREHRMFIEGTWYEITKWKDNSFWVIDSQGNPHAHTVYSEEDKKNFPDHCDLYGPCDYAKWFYTPEELAEVEAGTYNPLYKVKHAITVLPGNYHWVKLKPEDIGEDGQEWVIAQCRSKLHGQHGKHQWDLMRHTGYCPTDDDFAEIGERVKSREQQLKDDKDKKIKEELLDVIFPMADSIRVKGTEDEKWHAPIEYHFQFLRKAIDRYFKKSFESIKNSDLFF